MTERKCVCCCVPLDEENASRIKELCMRCYQAELVEHDEQEETDDDGNDSGSCD